MCSKRAEAPFLCERRRLRILDVRRRSAGGAGGTTLFRSASSDEDGCNPANIAASGSEQSNRARCASSSGNSSDKTAVTRQGSGGVERWRMSG
jgi:hypothetical protein